MTDDEKCSFCKGRRPGGAGSAVLMRMGRFQEGVGLHETAQVQNAQNGRFGREAGPCGGVYETVVASTKRGHNVGLYETRRDL